jgi:hypothetical protein
LHFGNVAGYYRGGCRDIKAAAASLATLDVNFRNAAIKGLRGDRPCSDGAYESSTRENKRKILHIGHLEINRSNYKSFAINDLL